jgi:hypothetical protein
VLDDIAKQLKIPSSARSAKAHFYQDVAAARNSFPRTPEHLSLRSLNIDLQEIWSFIGVQDSI